MNHPTCESDRDRTARALLTHLATPLDPVMSRLLGVMDPNEVLACIRARAVSWPPR